MNGIVYDKIIIGGGIAGLAAAYEIMDAARSVGRNIKLVVLTDRIDARRPLGPTF